MARIFIVFVFSLVLFACNESLACLEEGMKITEILLPAGENQTFFKTCECEGAEEVLLKWMNPKNAEITPKGQQPVLESTAPDLEPYTIDDGLTVALFIPVLKASLSGYYNCVREFNGKTDIIHSYKLIFYDPLRFSATSTDQFLVENTNSTVICKAKGDSEPWIRWYKKSSNDEYTSITEDDKYEVTSIGLTVRDVTQDDEGIYKCNAKVITTGEDLDAYINVRVYTIPEIVEVSANPNSTVLVNDSLTIECEAKGIPVVSYKWYKIENEVKLNGSWVQDYNKITFNSVSEDDRGTYECVAENLVGYSWKRIHIEVQTPPLITSFENIVAAEGDRIQVYCKAEGRPRPLIDVFFDGVDLEDDSRKGFVGRSSENSTEYFLTINKLLKTDEGIYICNASNDAGSDTKEMNLTVNYKPYFESFEEGVVYAWDRNPINLTCDYQSQPVSQVEWSFQPSSNTISSKEINQINRILLSPLTIKKDPEAGKSIFIRISGDENFGEYECKAKNDLGVAKKRFIVKKGTRPPLIEKATVTDLKATSVTFNIEGPSNAGPPILGYTAEYDEKDKYEEISIHPNRTWALDREFKLDKLNANTTYNVKFAALNKVGTGLFSEVLTFTTPEKSAPEPLTLDRDSNASHVSSDGNMILKLKAAEDNGEEIDYYAIQYCPLLDEEEDDIDVELCKEVVTSPTTEVKFKDLMANTTYMFMLVAHNSVGNSTRTIYKFQIPEFYTEAKQQETCCTLSAGTLIGISLVVVILCIVVLDLILMVTLKKGMIAKCCFKKNKKVKDGSVQSRDKKGLLKHARDATEDEALKQPDNGLKEYEYNKVTGIITGKHSAV